MKSLVLLVLAVAVTTATPYARRPPIEEIIVVPDFSFGRDSWFSPIPEWFGNLPSFSDFMAGWNPFRDISDLMDKGNTTSETKVMNGTLITRNNTIYIDKDTGTIVHVSSVDIRPSDQTPDEVEEVTPVVEVSKDPESTEEIETNPSVSTADIDVPAKESNEIPNDKKQVEEIIPLGVGPENDYDKRNYYYNPDINNEIEVFDVEHKPIDLQNDLYVNSVLEDKIRQSGGMHQLDPDVELIDVMDGRIAETYPNTQIQSKHFSWPEELLS